MVSEVTIGDIRGLLLDTDKRPLLRLLPRMDEVCRGYAIAHLGDIGRSIEAIASQVWLLNAIDWMRAKNEIYWRLCKTLAYSGFDGVLHEFAMRAAEDLLVFHGNQGGQDLKESWELLQLKRRWIEGEVSKEELDKARTVSWDASIHEKLDLNVAAAMAAFWATDTASYRAASRAVDWVVFHAAYRSTLSAEKRSTKRSVEKKRQMELLGDMLEDSAGIQRGVEGKTLDSKVFSGKTVVT